MRFIIALAFIVAVVSATQYGDSCTHTGVQAKDDAACVGTNNNMLCGTSGKCVCLDEYGASTDHFAPAADKQSCTKQ